MSTSNGTGAVYPTLELGGVTYALKFTRYSLLYRLSRRGIQIADRYDPVKGLAALFDIVHAIISDQFKGTAEDLATLAGEENKIAACRLALDEALVKVFPPTLSATPQSAGETASKPS